ncbi:MAG: peptidylprolyl isomerase, partial [Planctomycetes bacterium]|nr:peptidylprolyl isomerase [Planctomycetota bacterium]
IRKHVGDANIEQVAFSLKAGEISPVVQVGNQYLILKCEEQIQRTYVSAEQMPDIEKQLKQQILDHKMRVESANVFQQLQSQAQITKIMGDAQLQSRYPGLAALVNGRRITTQQMAEECVTRHGKDVLEGEINRRLLQQELRRRNLTVAEQDIDLEVTRAADAYGYVKQDGQPDIEAWLKSVTEGDQTTIELYVRDAVWPSVALKKLVGDKIQVTQDDVQKGFESNFGERVEVLAMVLGSHRQAQQVWEQARNNSTDEFFGELAHQYSIEPTSRANFGKVPPIRKFGGQPLVEKEAFQLKPGELSGLIAVGDQYVILRCIGRTKPVVTDLSLVQVELQKDLHEKKLRIAMAEEFDRLKESAQIDNFLAGTSQLGLRPGATKTASPASYAQPAGSSTGGVRR